MSSLKICEIVCTLFICLYGMVHVHRGNFISTFATNHEQHSLTIGFIYCRNYCCYYGHM